MFAPAVIEDSSCGGEGRQSCLQRVFASLKVFKVCRLLHVWTLLSWAINKMPNFLQFGHWRQTVTHWEQTHRAQAQKLHREANRWHRLAICNGVKLGTFWGLRLKISIQLHETRPSHVCYKQTCWKKVSFKQPLSTSNFCLLHRLWFIFSPQPARRPHGFQTFMWKFRYPASQAGNQSPKRQPIHFNAQPTHMPKSFWLNVDTSHHATWSIWPIRTSLYTAAWRTLWHHTVFWLLSLF